MLKERFEKTKTFVKDHKEAIITGAITTSVCIMSVIYIIYSKESEIKDKDEIIDNLEKVVKKHDNDIKLVKKVLNENVANNLILSTKRMIKYRQGKLENLINNKIRNNISEETIELVENEICDLFKELHDYENVNELLSK